MREGGREGGSEGEREEGGGAIQQSYKQVRCYSAKKYTKKPTKHKSFTSLHDSCLSSHASTQYGVWHHCWFNYPS